jgi:TP901 family phage tail tape measure protein
MTITLGSAAGKIEIDTSGVTSGIAAAQKSLQGAQTSMQSVGSAAKSAGAGLMSLGAPIVAFGGIAAKVAGDFESQMNILSVAAQSGDTSLENLRSVAVMAGQDTRLVGVSAADVAGAMTGFTKAGLDTNQMLGDMQGYLGGTSELGGALRAAVDLAAASELDLGEASDLVTVTMNTFGLGADQVVGAMSNYVQSADASVASVSDLRDAMINIGPTAAAFGFNLEDTNAALAILSTRGITGAEAGTALKSMLTNIMRGTPEVTQALKDLNISLYDQAGNMRSLPDIVGQLSTSLNGMTEEQRNAYVQTLAGSYGMKAMNTLLAEGTSGWQAMEDKIAGAATMQQSAAAQTKGFNAAMENLKSSVETFMITAGTPLIENVLTPLIRFLTDVMGKLSTMNPEWIKWAVVIGGVVTAVGGFLMLVGQAAAGISAIATLVGLAGPLFAGLGGAVAAAGTAILAALGPVLLIVAAVAAVAALLYLAWKNNFLGIRDIVDEVWGALKATFEQIKAIVGSVMAFLRGEISFDDMSARVGAAMSNIGAIWSGAWERIKEIAGTAWETIKGVFGRALEAVGRILLEGIARFIAPLVGGMDNAKRIVTEAWENIRTFLENIWSGIKTSAAAAFEALKGIVAAAVEGLRTVVAFILSGLSGDWSTAFEGLKTGAARIFGEISGTVGRVAETIRTGLAGKWESLRANAAERWEAVHGAITSVVGRIKTFVVTTLGELVTAAAGLFGKILDAISGRGEGAATAGGAGLGALLNVPQLQATIVQIITLIQGMQAQVSASLVAVALAFASTWLLVQGITTATWTMLVVNASASAEALRAGVVSAVESMRDGVVAAVQNLHDRVMAILSSMEGEAYDAGAALARAFGDGIRAEMESALDDARRLADEIRSLLPGSDAEKGPLSDLTAAGRALPATLGKGIGQGMAGALSAAGMLAAGMAQAWQMPAPMPAYAYAGAGQNQRAASSAPAQQNITVNIHNPLGEPAETSMVRQLRNMAYLGILG